MAEAFHVTGTVQRFEGGGGWLYVELPDTPGFDLRACVTEVWPKLLAATCSIGTTSWQGSIMPMNDGPLFVAITMPIRQATGISADDETTTRLQLLPDQ